LLDAAIIANEQALSMCSACSRWRQVTRNVRKEQWHFL
jgi:hypothetical protein